MDKKSGYIGIVIHYWLARLVILYVFFVVFPGIETCSQNNSLPIIDVYFAGDPGIINVETAALKYNKDFAISLHLDDGNRDIYTHAFSLLEGGGYTHDGRQYRSNGLFFTDGCGNRVSFKMAAAIYSFSGYQNTDLHGHEAGLTWVKWHELQTMIDSGWAVYNHGLTGSSTNDYFCSFHRNHSYIKRMLADTTGNTIEMKVMSLPFGDLNYRTIAFDAGYNLLLWMHGFGVPALETETQKNWECFSMGASLLENYANLNEYADKVASLCYPDKHCWACGFTHMITGDQLSFERFKSFAEYAFSEYGAGGKDNIWFASAEEVYDYLLLKSRVAIKPEFKSQHLRLTLDGKVPEGLRWYALSLIIHHLGKLDSVVVSGADGFTFCTSENKTLLNLNWNPPYDEDCVPVALKYIEIAENSDKPQDCITEIAYDYIMMVSDPRKRQWLIDKLLSIKKKD